MLCGYYISVPYHSRFSGLRQEGTQYFEGISCISNLAHQRYVGAYDEHYNKP